MVQIMRLFNLKLDEKTIMNGEYVWFWKKVVVTYFKDGTTQFN
jgi:hypothetical protein